MSSNKKIVDVGGKYAALVTEAFVLYRSYYKSHFQKDGFKPRNFDDILEICSQLPISLAREALERYRNKDDPRPHPNYFKAICERLFNQYKKEGSIKNIWGRSI